MNKLIIIFLTAIGLLNGATLSSAPVYDIPLGNGQQMQVEICTDRIVHIRIAPEGNYAGSWLARYEIVKTDWQAVNVKQENQGQSAIFTTTTHRIAVNKNNGEITVHDAAGNTILQKLVFLPGSNALVSELGESINQTFGKHRSHEGIIGSEKAAGFEKTEVENYEQNSLISIDLADGERFYGGGGTSREHIQHRGEILRIWSEYQRTEIPQPFLMSSRGWGIFNNTTRKNFFDVGRFHSEQLLVYNLTGGADFYLLLGENMPGVLNLYTTVIGHNYLLPQWAYGLSFGGNMLENQFEVMDDVLRFREEQVPLDMVWIEPQWMRTYYDFSTQKTWDYNKFPGEYYWEEGSPNKYEHHNLLPGRLHQLGCKLSLWLCIDHDLSIEEEDFLATQAGKPLSGQEHWFPHLTQFMDQGVDGFKLDPGKTLDEHPDRIYYNGATDADMHPIQQILLPKQANRIFRNHKGLRPFLHYCGGWAGSQHWAASTSGDNGGEQVALFDQLNLGLSGFMNTSCDVMGVGSRANEMPSLHMGMFLPWIQINSWYYLLQPWYYPAKERAMYRDYIQLRYALFPYVYSAAIEGSRTGMPMLRAMPLVFPGDRNVDDMIFQYMFGENLLVGVFSDEIYLPEGEWINYWTDEKVTGKGKTEKFKVPDNRAGLLFIRNGAIIPYQQPVQYIGEKPLDTLILKVYPQGNSSYTLYEDDGLTFKHEQGEIATTLFECSETKTEIQFTIHPVQGYYEGIYRSRTYQLEIACPAKPKAVQIDGKAATAWRYEKGKLLMDLYQQDTGKAIGLKLTK